MKKEISVFSSFNRNSAIDVNIGTHSGIFHLDEVVAISLMNLYNDEQHVTVIRTRDPNELKKCHMLVDIGGGKFDHHQIGGNGKRENGPAYASAGLVWKEYGEEIIIDLAEIAGFQLDDTQVGNIFTTIDEMYIQPVDAIDNGYKGDASLFEYITAFLPDWKSSNDNAFNEAFREAVTATTLILRKLITKTIEEEYSYCWIMSSLHANNDKIFELPAQTFPWNEPIIDYNAFHYNVVDFVIFPYPAGGWAAQCVPPSRDKIFEQRIPFPKEWAGQTTNLPQISGVLGATFCHNNCFFVRASTKEAVMLMCKKAIEAFEE